MKKKENQIIKGNKIKKGKTTGQHTQVKWPIQNHADPGNLMNAQNTAF